jgi:hypothetical protein
MNEMMSKHIHPIIESLIMYISLSLLSYLDKDHYKEEMIDQLMNQTFQLDKVDISKEYLVMMNNVLMDIMNMNYLHINYILQYHILYYIL